MCTIGEESVNGRNKMCWCFEEISLMILLQRILMYLWYRLLLKMFPRLSVLPNCDHGFHPRQLPCGQLADEYWKASRFSRTPQRKQLCYEEPHKLAPILSSSCCQHVEEPACGKADLVKDEMLDELNERFNFDCSDFSHVYQSTFLEEIDDCFLPGDISWDIPVPDQKQHLKDPLDTLLLLNDYYIDDDLNDHLHAAEYHGAAIEAGLFGEGWM
ncbi:uncharacterized protein LOC131208086 [Anopheles bellator]|uniref:uncharacterized protein LOC131208086 n=1 Tax=Anopheles bellator TaxID=139047 RepID=UPI002648C7EC|nr:uncharacterized protein LOC131208086 [Anopheles bellator]